MSDFRIEIEIFEGRGGQLQKDADEIIWPDYVKEGLCAWMRDSLQGVIQALKFGGTLGWSYHGTPYEKVIDPESLTT